MTTYTIYCVYVELLVTKDKQTAQALADVLSETNITVRVLEEKYEG